MSPADVAMVSPYSSLRSGSAMHSGVAFYAERLATSLAAQGARVKVFAPHMAGEPLTGRHRGVEVERNYRRGPAALLAATSAARDSGAPVVHVQHEAFLFGGLSSLATVPPALYGLRRLGLGPVVTMHQVVDPAAVDDEFTRLHRVRVPSRLARTGLSALQRSIDALSAATVIHEASFGRMLSDAVVVPIGIDRRLPLPSGPSKQSLGLASDRLTALCFGFLAPYKGLEVALEAARLAGPAVDLVVAGGEHPRLAGSDNYAKDLQDRYHDAARFVGYVPDGEVAGWYSAADVALLPYPRPFASSGPLTLALGFGTPPLCSPALGRCVAAPPELVAPTDAHGLAHRLIQLAGDPGRLAGMGAAARQMAAGRSWPEVARRHLALYEEVINAHRSPGRRVRPRQPR